MRSLRSWIISRLRKDERGAAVLETALALPVLMLLAFAFIDLTQAFAFRMSLQEYSQAGSDFIVASGIDEPTDAEIKAAVASHSGLPLTAITITRPFDCNGNSQSLTSNACPNSTDHRVDYVRIKVQDTYDPMLSMASFADFMPSRTISASSTVRLP